MDGGYEQQPSLLNYWEWLSLSRDACDPYVVPPRPDRTANDAGGHCGGTIGDGPEGQPRRYQIKLGDLGVYFCTLSLHIITHSTSQLYRIMSLNELQGRLALITGASGG